MSGTNLARPTARRRMIKQGNETEPRHVTRVSTEGLGSPAEQGL